MASMGVYQGWATLLLLLAAGALSPTLPTAYGAAAVLVFGALGLERFGVDLARNYRISPASPVYLATGMMPDVGCGLAVVAVGLGAALRLERGFLNNLAQSGGVATGLLGIAIYRLADLPSPDLSGVVGALLYLAFQLGAQRLFGLPTNQQEKLIWYQLHFQIRPLEGSLAFASPALAAACAASPLLGLALLPLLASAHLAAENVLLKANDKTLVEVLRKLKGAQDAQRKATLERDRAERDKQLLEGFAAHLAGKPTLEMTARTLVATVRDLVEAQSVVVFLGSPPEPFSYRVSDEHRESLQGAALTGLREPLVDKVHAQRKAALQKTAPEATDRLLPNDVVAAAIPLGAMGALYVGRENDTPFSKSQLDSLRWLADKATLALEAAYGVNEAARQKRQQQQEMRDLQKQISWLANLIRGAEEMASSLHRETLCERFRNVLQGQIAHQAGQIFMQGDKKAYAWGGGAPVDSAALDKVAAATRPILLEPGQNARYGEGLKLALASPLLAGKDCVGCVVLLSSRGEDFSRESMDLLFLLSSQAAMALSHARLYSEVVEARQQLEESQAQLVQSSKMTALGQLAAGVAHELNSPLGAIFLCVEESVAQLEDNPSMVRRLLLKSLNAVERSKEIVKRLMTYSRQPSNSTEDLCLSTLAAETVEFLTFQLRSASVRVVLDGDQTAMVRAEPQPLQQVLTNLILNAAQAMEQTPAADREIRLKFSQTDEFTRLDVIDGGCGIPAENLERIFDPFYTTKPVGQGTGLGLWASHQIVAQHGGSLTVRSQPGQGSTFTVTLPGPPAG